MKTHDVNINGLGNIAHHLLKAGVQKIIPQTLAWQFKSVAGQHQNRIKIFNIWNLFRYFTSYLMANSL